MNKQSKIWKRVLSFVLTVGMVVSLLIPAVGALEVDETIQYILYSGGSSNVVLNPGDQILHVSATDGYAAYLCSLDDLTVKLAKSSNGLSCVAETAGQWFAIKITVPAAGIYNVKFGHRSTTGGAPEGKVIVLPGSYASKTAAEIDAALEGTDAMLVCTTDYTDKATSGVTYENQLFGQAGDYVVVFTAEQAGTIQPQYLNFTYKGAAAPAAEVATIEGKGSFATVDLAVAAAANGDTIVLKETAAAAAGIELAAGVKLDLQGNTLTANVTGAGAVIDGVGGGKLEGTMLVSGSNGGYLPVAVEGGYAFFAVAGEAVKVDGADKLKFQVKLSNAGYDALAAGTSGAEIGATFAWGENTKMYDITYEDASLAEKWGAAVAANGYKDGYIVLGFSGLEAFADLSVAPYVRNEETGVVISLGSVTLK